MHTRHLAAVTAISMILAACTTAVQPAAPGAGQTDSPGLAPVATNPVAGFEAQQDAGTTRNSTTTLADPDADPVAESGGGQTVSEIPPATTTSTSAAEETQTPLTTTTTQAASSTEDINDLLDDLDSLLSSLGDQLGGLDGDLAEVDASLNANEGDIEK